MRLLTLNIRFGAGSEAPERFGYDLPVTETNRAALCAAIASVRPDVVALQEVRGARQAERLADVLGMGFLYTPHRASYAFDFFEWGLAILFRPRLIRSASRSIYFDESVRSGRQGLMATLDADGTPVSLVNLHLDPLRIDRQVKAVCDWIQTAAEPLILMGDFNCLLDDVVLAPFWDRWIDSCRAIRTPETLEAERVGTLLRGTGRFDYILSDPKAFVVSNAGLVPAAHRRVSDHVGYFAEICPIAV